MEPLLVALTVVSIVLSIAVLALVVVLLRRAAQQDSGETARVIQSMSAELQAVSAALQRDVGTLRDDLSKQRMELAEQLRGESAQARQAEIQLRTELAQQLKDMQLENADRIQKLTQSNSDKHVELQRVLSGELATLRKENEQKLEQMRQTVDEKLQGTLEKRLGESFKLVSEQLDLVSKGLGEMQTLASDVGGLKRVLTNVKSRGTWGEVQLERQLEDILTRDQYEQNVAIRPGSSERVEFAVRLPGRADDEPVYLPIDSKFPREDFDRLQEAQDAGDKLLVEQAAAALERAVVEQAKLISSKYVHPPHSTDFAIMYLPFESLFAEVVRRPGLIDKLQRMHRVQVAGPSTLMAYLNSLQMGFRTLAIEKRSSEVWQVLAAAKNEFRKYGEVMDRLKKQLGTAQNTVDMVGTRTRAINRALRNVEVSGTETAIGITAAPFGDDEVEALDASLELDEAEVAEAK